MTVALLETWLSAGLDESDSVDVRSERRSHRPRGAEEFVADDHVLAERIRADDSQAFDALALRHIPALVRFASAIVGDRDSAQDVVQTVLARVWERRAALNPTGSVVAYLCAMVRNQALDVRRRDDARTRVGFAVGETLSATIPAPDDVEESEETRALRAAFFAMPERYRTVLQLRYGQRLGYADIAETLALTVKGAERLLARAMAALRRNMGVE